MCVCVCVCVYKTEVSTAYVCLFEEKKYTDNNSILTFKKQLLVSLPNISVLTMNPSCVRAMNSNQVKHKRAIAPTKHSRLGLFLYLIVLQANLVTYKDPPPSSIYSKYSLFLIRGKVTFFLR